YAFYVDLFAERRAVLDVGCGRGPFLAACERGGVRARGVDSDPAMVRACLDQGLAVTMADAFEYLESLAPASLDGLFSAQFVEHLIVEELVSFIRLASEKVAP